MSDRRLKTIANLAVIAFGCTMSAEGAPRYPLDASVVTHALEQLGVTLDPAQVHLPAALTSASAAPSLVVYHAERSSDGRVRMQMKCEKAGDCLAFTVGVDVDGSGADDIVHLVSSTQASDPLRSSSRGIPNLLQRSDMGTSQALVHPGQQLTLWLEAGRLRIHLPVIAMDRADRGMKLRVCTSDRKNIYHAIVLDRSTAKGIVEW